MINKLKEIRLKYNYTQEYIASELGITQKAYSKIENGQTCLSQDKLIKLTNLYKISPDYFCNMSCDCSNNNESFMLKIKDFLKEKGVELPDFLK